MSETDANNPDHLRHWLDCFRQMEASRGSEELPLNLDSTDVVNRVDRARMCLGLLEQIWPHELPSTASARSTDDELTGTSTVSTRAPAGELVDGAFEPDGALSAFDDATARASHDHRHRLGRFLILECIGGGGHGIVYRARDPILERDVALKLPRPESLGSAELRQRFVRESRALARLTHPNLVSVYEAGMIGPVCYLATAFCPGPSLAKWISQQNGLVDVHVAARLMRKLAETVDYIHDQGIVHRDIKPSNVLMDPMSKITSGTSANESPEYEPKLTDFGLAKWTVNAQEATRTGAVIGTPTYMAPEQAAGRTDEVGAATDIYALGAVLYELIVGDPPFRGQSDLDTLHLVAGGLPAAPRGVRPRIPRDLEAICLKCLEHNPRHRYGTGRELAGDLDRYLQGEPVQARRVNGLRRIVKWSQRRPMTASLSVALGCAVVLGFVLVTWQWQRASWHRQRAQENFRQAHQAVQEMHNLLLDRDEYNRQEFLPLRKELIQLAIKYYLQFRLQDDADLVLVADLADAYYHIGFVAHSIGSQGEALKLYEKSLPLWNQLTQEVPDNREYWYYFAKLQASIGQLQVDENRIHEALLHLMRAHEIRERLVARYPGEFEGALSDSLMLLAKAYREAGQPTDALPFARQGVALRESVTEARMDNGSDNDKTQIQKEVAETYQMVGSICVEVGELDEAAVFCRKALRIQQALMNRVPYIAGDLAQTMCVMAKIQAQRGNHLVAIQEYKNAKQVLEKLINEFPTAAPKRSYLATVYESLADEERALGLDEDAIAHRKSARHVLHAMIASDPTVMGYHVRLMRCCESLGRDCLAGDRKADAATFLSEARDVCNQLLNSDPGNKTLHDWSSRIDEGVRKARRHLALAAD